MKITEIINSRFLDFKTSLRYVPTVRDVTICAGLFSFYASLALTIATKTKAFRYSELPVHLDANMGYILIALAINSFGEEAFFRGILFPHKSHRLPLTRYLGLMAINTALFIIWHPLLAAVFHQSSEYIFFNKIFLVITGLLGITCGTAYLISGSLWIPFVIHVVTVYTWLMKFNS